MRLIVSASVETEWLWGGSEVDDEIGELLEGDPELEVAWTIKRAHWRIRVEPIASDGDGRRMQVILCAVKIEASTRERARNSARGFLGSG
jgi:hypothetical protein